MDNQLCFERSKMILAEHVVVGYKGLSRQLGNMSKEELIDYIHDTFFVSPRENKEKENCTMIETIRSLRNSLSDIEDIVSSSDY